MSFLFFTDLNYVSVTILLFLLYKLLDRLVRIPRIGGYTHRYVLVTGAGTGFGYEAVRRLDALGCHVFAGVYLSTDVDTIRATCSSRVDTVMIDITKEESVQKAFEYVKSKIPEDKGLWGLVNNAGVCIMAGMEWLQMSDYEEHINTNALGAVRVTMTFMPLIKKARGRVVNTSSVAGRFTHPSSVAYSMSKYAIEAYSDALRRCMRPYGIKVAIIEPGGHRTPLAAGIRPGIMRMWERTPEAIRKELGQKSLDTVVKCTKSLPNFFISRNIGDVSDVYVHALMARYPRARYVVGRDANYIILPMSFLPEWLSDNIMKKST